MPAKYLIVGTAKQDAESHILYSGNDKERALDVLWSVLSPGQYIHVRFVANGLEDTAVVAAIRDSKNRLQQAEQAARSSAYNMIY